jgi:hypothetical protein
MRRVQIRIDFVLSMRPDEPYAAFAWRARQFLVEHAETLPMLYLELPAGEDVTPKRKEQTHG